MYMKKYFSYEKKAPAGIIADCAIEFEGNGEKFAITMGDYFAHLDECCKYKKLGYVYIF